VDASRTRICYYYYSGYLLVGNVLQFVKRNIPSLPVFVLLTFPVLFSLPFPLSFSGYDNDTLEYGKTKTHEHCQHPGDRDILVRAARGENTERTPVWLMRQAGRYMSAFREYSVVIPFRKRSMYQEWVGMKVSEPVGTATLVKTIRVTT
jgi:hypothetical protein